MKGYRVRLLSAGLVGALVAALLSAPPALATPGKGGIRQHTPSDPPVAVVKTPVRPAAPDQALAAAAARASAVPAPVWPTASTVDIPLSTVGPDRAAGGPATTPLAGTAQVGGAPVAVHAAAGGPTALRVQLYDQPTTHGAGVNGLLLRVARVDGGSATAPTQVSVDYSTFASAYGADWAARLRLVQVPACAVSTPSVAGCTTATPLASSNNVKAHTVTATVPVAAQTGTATDTRSRPEAAGAAGGTMLALAADAKSGDGDYSATSLASSSTWSAGGSAGDFAWTYPIRTPPSLGGPAPDIELSYSAQSVDGMMASTNNQPSWVGQGFEWWPGYIERSYQSCAEDMSTPGHNNTVKTGDECWETDNATLSMSGHSGELLKDGSDPNRWHLRTDDGTLVTHRTGTGNGDNDGEWWVVTTSNGTQYWFGGVPAANSTWTVPVYGNDPNEPCHQPAYADSSCRQAWRWNLDKVVDPHGNTMSYSYTKETNKYGHNNSTTDLVDYDRGGYLTQIDYGTRDGAGTPTPMRVSIDVADRCLSGCATHDKLHWPDTPWDEQCTGSPCTNGSPTFWATKRLTGITTKVWNGTAYDNVENWTFTHTFPDPGDGSRAGLWLSRISHTGLAGGNTTTVPDLWFEGVQLPNRVDTNNDHLFPMNWWRVAKVHTETGGMVSVHYLPSDCVAGSRTPDPAHLENNALRCYPVKWQPEFSTSQITDFFNKYVVDEVKEDDLTGGSPTVYTDYDYVGAPAWHYTDDNGIVKPSTRTWSVWRGYGTVRARMGDPTKMTQTLTETQYFRGMNGDHLPSGSRSVTLPAIAVGGAAPVPAAPDEDAYAATVRQKITYNGVGGPEISAQVNEPWQSAPTASRTINGTTVYARFVGVTGQHTRVGLDSDGGTRAPGVRTTSQYTTFDDQGAVVEVDDHGDDAATGDEKCTLTTYVRNTSAWLMSYPSRVRNFATTCAAAKAGGLTDDDITGDGITRYDGQAAGAAPTKGDVTETDTLKAYNNGNPTYLALSRAAFDVHGRVTDQWDIDSNHSTTAYTPATDGPVTKVAQTNQLGWTTTVTYNPAWGSVTDHVDQNGQETRVGYDGLGRTTQVWHPGHGPNPDITYSYLMRADGAVATTTNTLIASGAYRTTVSLLDGLLRPRQSQEPGDGTAGGRILADTYYDSAGRAYTTTGPYPSTGAPSTDLYTPKVPEEIPAKTVTTFDGANRSITTSFYTKSDFRWATTTSYTGDRTDTVPPSGGTPTSTVTDAADHTVARRQYLGSNTSAPYLTTSYTYNRKGQLTRVTDPAGTHWDYGYDIRGRRITATDPDKGASATTYDDAGRVVTVTDASNQTLAYTYDSMGRKTSVRDGSVTGPKRAEWVYDTLYKSLLTRSIRYDASGTYTNEVLGYNTRYLPTSSKVTIPASQTGFGATSFTYVNTYKVDGSPYTTRIPAAGGLPIETLTTGYNGFGLPATLSTNIGGTLVTGTGYTDYGEPGIVTLQNNAGRIAQIGNYYEDGTRRLHEIKTTSAAPDLTTNATFADMSYTYDSAGNVKAVADTANGDTQCYGYDNLRRLTDAWTPASGNCGVSPDATALGGPAPYWQSWTFSSVGDRMAQTNHRSNGTTTQTYTYPGAGAAHPHAVSSVTTTGGAPRTDTYGYDNSGNTASRPGQTGNQTLQWDPEGHLTAVTDTAGTTSYIYDADGNRLLRKDPTGKTLYLPGQEIRYDNASASATCTRYYSWAGGIVATRTPTELTWLSGDHHGTVGLTITATTQAVAYKRTTPYGDARGSTGTWPASMDKGFVGGTVDNTGLTHLGAREYDSTLGRFVSVDPVLDINDPQQMEGYAYSGNSPVTFSDPSGLMYRQDDGGGSGPDLITCDDHCGGKDGSGKYPVGSKPTPPAPPAPKPKNCHWYDVGCNVKKAATAVGNFYEQHKQVIATVAGVAAGFAAGLACEAATEGAGTLACIAVGSAVGNLVTDAVGGNIHSLGDAVNSFGTGLVQGLLSPITVPIDAVQQGAAMVQAASHGDWKGAAGHGAMLGLDALAIAGMRGGKGGGGKGGGCHSFAPDTAVLLADGSTKQIQDIQVGDEVASTDPQTGQDTAEPVQQLHLNHDSDLVDVTVTTDDGHSDVVHTTSHHPFWNADLNHWTEAADLTAGAHLRTLDGRTESVVEVKALTGAGDMRDLTVATVHTYYVVTAGQPVLVHNCPVGGSGGYQPKHAGGYEPTHGSSGPYEGAHRKFDPRDIDVATHAKPGKLRNMLYKMEIPEAISQAHELSEPIVAGIEGFLPETISAILVPAVRMATFAGLVAGRLFRKE